MPAQCALATQIERRLLARNQLFEAFFAREADRLADACHEMADRFLRGGRLLAIGRGPCATDAQHVSVEFVHPVIVGKRALPALDLSILFRPWVEALVRRDDMVMGFGPPEGDSEICAALDDARSKGAMTFTFCGPQSSFAVSASTSDPFMHQELIEILYHTLWETVHVFFEHRELGQDAGEAAFLYPFLGHERQGVAEITKEVADSIRMKVADDSALRARVAAEESEQIGSVVSVISECVRRGGKLIIFGNGGSATDANDWAMDCVSPPNGHRAVPAVSLSLEPANISAIANDIGVDVIFLRQFIAHAQPDDVVIGISTSGGSRNIIMALEEARKRKIPTAALLGYDGGEILRRRLVDFPIVVHCDYIPRIQEVQASIYHVIREALEVCDA